MILVTGATGNVGRNVVAQLLAAGRRVRAVTRNPDAARLPRGAEVFGADLAEPDSLDGALRGIERLFLFPRPETAEQVLALARRRGVRRVVLLSASAVLDHDERNLIGAMHREVEDAVTASGLAATFVRPGGFAANALGWAPSIRAEGVVRAPYPELASAPVHERDIAAVATAALLEDGHEGAAYQLTGPHTLTQLEQVASIGVAAGRDIRFEEQTPQQARAQLLRAMPAPVVDSLLHIWARLADPEPEPEKILPTVEQVTGRPPSTFAQWAHEHSEAFR
ncbi:MAG TPA: NAD(P)H-binding protein [Pseudonocardia sp.]|jgi:uncharacterized protein YbjT (DUF2867 family)|uniref:NAD(P)H-binding protein n=1 Tax=Pseudonocardia sp. TaxID=60912 RepID=UPI002F40D8EF